MQKIIFTWLIFFGLWSFPGHAGESPEAFLAELLTSDFAGDCEARFDNVHYTTELDLESACECSGPRREYFAPDFTSLFIVSDWRIIGTDMESADRAVVTVGYRVLAKAERTSVERENDTRLIEPYDPPRSEEIAYKVRLLEGRWMWVDPPEMPRVGLEAVKKAVEKEIDEYRRLISARGDNGLWGINLKIYKAELAALEALGRSSPE